MAAGCIQQGCFQDFPGVMFECNWVCSESAQGPFRISFSGKLGDPTQTVGRTALWQNYCADNTPDTRSKPVVRRSLFLVFCTCWESSRSLKVPQNEIRVDIRIILLQDIH